MLMNLHKLANELKRIDDFMVKAEKENHQILAKIHPSNHKNAVNLLHYLALRSLEVRELQDSLHAYGLSSMASSESHIRGQLLSILQHLGEKKGGSSRLFDYETSKLSVSSKSSQLFGNKQIETIPYIMVTFDSSLSEDYEKVKNLLQSGMNVARINCAHDDEDTWFSMIQHIKRASKTTGLNCKLYMDLAGPKIRTIIPNKGKLKVKVGMTVYLTDEFNLKDDKLTIGCTVQGITEQLKKGEIVLFDDGLIEARVEKVEPSKIKMKILRISSKKPFVKDEKGINFPESTLQMSALTEYDIKCLPFIKKYSDMVGYSFVRSAKDILDLQQKLNNDKKLALILKIETPEAVKNLPELLFCAMQQENVGVMIARGDLAVEIGFERMSEIQEEILWICEAAHIPVIWATQVLENLNKSGVATRSEVTDAAHASYADCVMINKGTFIIQTIETLKDILFRSGGHHLKKRYTFRPLEIAKRFLNN